MMLIFPYARRKRHKLTSLPRILGDSEKDTETVDLDATLPYVGGSPDILSENTLTNLFTNAPETAAATAAFPDVSSEEHVDDLNLGSGKSTRLE